ncbi:MAG: iron complex outermembrane receptor protein [Paraglaciecola psychrophila]|jgi:iron complex outermembrane receptor protein
MTIRTSTSCITHQPRRRIAATIIATVLATAAQSEGAGIEEIIVSADFRPHSLQTTAASLSVITADSIAQRGAQHVEDILAMAANVNIASGSSRARYFQIRGIGERSQFSQPINPSVGVIIDDVDFSGIATAATLFDVEQVEVLRGPQGTRYGANALAGLINIRSKAPVAELGAQLAVSTSSYGTRSVGAVVNVPLSDVLSARLAVQQYQSDGFIKNRFLGVDDTNDRDELSSRLSIRWTASEQLQLDISASYIDIDNGYDAFSLDNNRNTLSDQPGVDTQRSDALSVRASYELSAAVELEAIVSYSQSESEYAYDEDWAYVGITGCQSDYSFCEYSSYDQYLRGSDRSSIEFRALSGSEGKLFGDSTDWVVGFYQASNDSDLTRNYTYSAAPLVSDYNTDNTAVYGQLEWQLNERATLVTGLRFEQWQADYQDSNALQIDHDEDLVGGKVALELVLSEQHLAYVALAKGYKAGGVNTNDALPSAERSFDTEYLWNFETGLNSQWLNNALHSRLSVFYTQRRDQQVKGSFIILREDRGPQFVDYIANAADGNNYGLEAELDWQVSEQWQLFGSLGLLATEIEDYINPEGFDVSGRDQAHAPGYQFNLGTVFTFDQYWSARLELEGRDSFYFSNRHDSQSASYALVNARIGYQAERWDIALWGRNLGDRDYQTRGFAFANDPRNDYSVGGYQQLGEPRVVGLSANYRF